MRHGDDLRQSMKLLRKAVEQTVNAAARSGRGRTVNVASRRNVRVVANIGRDGAVTGASAHQDAPIHQDGGDGQK